MNTSDTKHLMEAAVQRIQNKNLKSWVYAVLEQLPERAWQREASLKYHHEDERGRGGNVLHQIRAAEVAHIIAVVCNLAPLDRDLVYAAALIHDCCRHGLAADAMYTAKNHATLVRSFIEANCEESEWTDPICTLIDTHMSRWGSPPHTPSIELRDIVVLADFIVSQPNVKVQE